MHYSNYDQFPLNMSRVKSREFIIIIIVIVIIIIIIIISLCYCIKELCSSMLETMLYDQLGKYAHMAYCKCI